MSTKIFIFFFLFVLNLGASQRIVSLSPSLSEIVYALGAGEQLVATSEYSLYPKEVQKLPTVGGFGSVNIERVISYIPSLVLGQDYNQASLEQLKSLKITTLSLKLRTIKDIQNSIQILGKTLNKQKEAQKLLRKIQTSIDAIPLVKEPHSVMIVYGLKEDLRSGIYIAGDGIFFDDIITLSHNTNAYTDNTTNQPVLNYENVIALNPEQIIILHSHATEADVDVQKALKAWYSLPTRAAQNRRISVVDEDYLHIPSHRVSLTIQRLAREMNDRVK